VRIVETVLVVGALAGLAYWVWRRSRPGTVPLGQVASSAPGQVLGAAAWLQADPLGWITRDTAWGAIGTKEEELL
jgi:uncharacterized membrane protein